MLQSIFFGFLQVHTGYLTFSLKNRGTVCIKLVALRMHLYQEVALSFKKVGDPCAKGFLRMDESVRKLCHGV